MCVCTPSLTLSCSLFLLMPCTCHIFDHSFAWKVITYFLSITHLCECSTNMWIPLWNTDGVGELITFIVSLWSNRTPRHRQHSRKSVSEVIIYLQMVLLLLLQLLNTIDSCDLMWIPMLAMPAMLIMLTFLCVSRVAFAFAVTHFLCVFFEICLFCFWFPFSQTTMNGLMMTAAPHLFFSVRSRISRLHIKLRNSKTLNVFVSFELFFNSFLLLLLVVVVRNRTHIVIDLISQNRIRFAVFVSLWATIQQATKPIQCIHARTSKRSFIHTRTHTGKWIHARAKYRCQFANYMAYDFCEQTHTRAPSLARPLSHTLLLLFPWPNIHENWMWMWMSLLCIKY